MEFPQKKKLKTESLGGPVLLGFVVKGKTSDFDGTSTFAYSTQHYSQWVRNGNY